ncbi:MAG: TolC family protein [Prevotellaceae bacterium]|jgi:outer membrane protein TolC|nr:TolC family protein [Prevotellaceae bacterium]
MKIIKPFVILVSLIAANSLWAVDTLELATCKTLARENYPLAKQKGLYGESLALTLKSLTTASYFPKFNIAGEASYQSDVTHFPGTLPISIELPAKDQYHATLNIQQTLFDGNRSPANKAVERLNAQELEQMNEAEMLNVEQQVQQIYFNGLLQQKAKENLLLTQQVLEERIRLAQSALRNGVILQRDLNLLEVQLRTTEKQIAEATLNQQSCVKILALITGADFNENSAFTLPAAALVPDKEPDNRRPEMQAFDTRINRLEANKNVLNTQLTPTIQAYGTLGYGRPGLNMLSNNFDPFYIVGLRLNWTPWDGNLIQQQKKNLDIQRKVVANQKAAFDNNVRTQAQQKRSDIQKQEELLKQDMEIAQLRRTITKESASQLDNGAITTGDYIADLNAETQARISVEISKIQLVKAQLDYLLILGQ